MSACDMCGADTLLMVNVALGATRPTYTYRCPRGHITKTDPRSSPQPQGIPSFLSAVDVPATSPPPPPPPDGEVAGPHLES
jgi:hypothetical protein